MDIATYRLLLADSVFTLIVEIEQTGHDGQAALIEGSFIGVAMEW